MIEMFNNNFFGIFLSVAVFLLARKICERFKSLFANPLLVSAVFIICFLKIFGIPLEYFEKGGNMLFRYSSKFEIFIAMELGVNYRKLF